MKKISPLAIIVFSFLIIIALGTILFFLPISTKQGINLSFVDAFFLSVSSVCITGLSPVVSIGDTFSVFGQIVLALLIQIGGLGIVTIGVYVLTLLGSKIGISERILLKEALNQNNNQELIKLVKTIIKTTIVIELIGACLNFIVFIQDFNFFRALGISIFHSISAFNNAGMDIIGGNGLVDYSSNVLLNFSTTLMVFLGGLGFIAIMDIIRKKKYKTLMIHTKIVLKVSIVLIISSTILIKVSEGNNITWLQAYFLSIINRTAGFPIFNFTRASQATLLITILYMFIGASPCSTGGGIKTTTFYTMIKSIASFATGKRATIYKRKIGDETKQKAFTLIVFAFTCIFIATTAILMIEKNSKISLGSVFFEVTSAFSTTGHSLGVTLLLTVPSRLILCLLMFIGRLGPLTLIGLWNKNWNHPSSKYEVDYIEEKIMIG